MIDWKEQWALHSRYFRDGFLEVNLKEFGGQDRTLKLHPGPGFGDLSHPTTRLTLRMMLPRIKDKIVLDVGCGSGILALAAAASGAKVVYGLDIDEEAVAHARQNALLNGLEVTWGAPKRLEGEAIALMNMIRSEQAIAWGSLKELHPHIGMKITSGVLLEEKELYRTEMKNWEIKEMKEEEGWLGFTLSSCKSSQFCHKGSSPL